MRDARTAALAALVLGLSAVASPAPAAEAAGPTQAASLPPETVTQLAGWVLSAGDNRDLPFLIIDKASTKVFVFAADGQLQGAAPALLGLARGDDSTPGVGDRELSAIRPKDRTTPAGRFLAAFGPAIGQARVLWVDYATAISLHPVVTTNPKERRVARLRSPTPKDNRITYGCINVSAAFYRNVVSAAFAGGKGVVYILPEKKPLDEVFPTFAVQLQASRAQTGDPAMVRDLGGSLP